MPLSDDAIQTLASAVRMAPSAENLQPWKFVVVSDEDVKRKLAGACTNGRKLPEAPIVFVACARLDDAQATIGGYMNSYPVDVGMAISYLTLAATNLGLGTNSERHRVADQQRHLWKAEHFRQFGQSFRAIKKPLFQCKLVRLFLR